jgi:hypothetical protein
MISGAQSRSSITIQKTRASPLWSLCVTQTAHGQTLQPGPRRWVSFVVWSHTSSVFGQKDGDRCTSEHAGLGSHEGDTAAPRSTLSGPHLEPERVNVIQPEHFRLFNLGSRATAILEPR